MGRYPAPPLPKRRFEDAGGTSLADSVGQNAVPNSSRDPQEIRRVGRESWLKTRQQQPPEDLEKVRRQGRENWLAKRGPESKK